MSNVNIIKASHLCYGCGTCNVVCGHQAITMHYDNIGRLLPYIDESKCTNCKLCYNHCPSLDLKGIQLSNTEDKYVGHVEKVFIGKAADDRIYRNSQSGGLVTATVKYLLNRGLIDAAVMCRVEDEIDYTPKAVIITKSDNLYSCQKSSYVPIDIVSALKQVDKYQSIAVVGTGCHIQGVRALQNFNQKYRDKIKYTLGLICDRTLCKTSTDVLYGGQFKNKRKRIIWRDKSKNYETARLLIRTEDNVVKEIPRWKRFALKDPFTNPRCRICFDKLNTNADIVFGDPWGMSNVDWQNGMSLVICRTLKGTDLVRSLTKNHQAILNEAPLDEVIEGQFIEERKDNVSKALAYYKRRGWIMPNYAGSISSTEEDLQINNLINTFEDDSRKEKEVIIKQNLLSLYIFSIKSRLKFWFSFPIIIIRKILR